MLTATLILEGSQIQVNALILSATTEESAQTLLKDIMTLTRTWLEILISAEAKTKPMQWSFHIHIDTIRRGMDVVQDQGVVDTEEETVDMEEETVDMAAAEWEAMVVIPAAEVMEAMEAAVATAAMVATVWEVTASEEWVEVATVDMVEGATTETVAAAITTKEPTNHALTELFNFRK